ncbi:MULTISPECIES: OFA family MFS transporter [Pseudomonas]|jgi:MFS family permease|uniref:OFA family MFS transporter n=1 Tax=Pseudomonas TaxID=286 RepID=UPI000D6AF232|nr:MULTISPECIES: OFA family MFS transporter [Pseudomonas]AXP06536.1 MFS transporter [Pseudomonas fluorescens]PWJ40385.1 nitrate/nitrite transporter NarK [Pseudomonas sp. 43mfcvi1.1]QIB05513.1 OFA family MFS transporter [Pseudomonas fluorescens]UQI31550.1 OFA family MFS transporter [Pseudomonas bijieensis]WLH63337.1 OFA family MFS transporter [Pseudomonas sp. FP2300]
MSTSITAGGIADQPAFLSKERIIAKPGFNRWLVPPAALAIHLCIGMAYGFSVFWLPLSKALGISKPVACAPDMSFISQVFSSQCDWPISMLGWIYTLFFIFLGCSAAIWGGWLEHAGPRKAGVVSALCWCGGLLISALGIYTHQIWLMWVGSGVIGGIGLGLGYISPVSTLIKWFPDKRGMATGMAIMGFGGGAMVGAPLAAALMSHFASPTGVGVWQSFLVMAAIYFVFMIGGALSYRVPPTGWKPEGWTPAPKKAANAMITHRHVHVNVAWKTPQFRLVWLVLCLNVSAGIGILGMASPLLQEVFGGKLLGNDLPFGQLDATQLGQIAAIAAGFTGLLSLFNIGGRFFWASFSDYLGRKNTYFVFFALGFALYALIPNLGHLGSVALFVAAFCIILSMYGGGFATVPAYLADLFGTQMVGAIHGRLLTAWAAAGVLGPVLVNYLREYQLSIGVERAAAYDITLYILSGLLVLGFLCNLLVRPVADKYFMTDAELAAEQALGHDKGADSTTSLEWKAAPGTKPLAVAAWLVVGIPLAWGVWVTLQKTAVLFR